MPCGSPVQKTLYYGQCFVQARYSTHVHLHAAKGAKRSDGERRHLLLLAGSLLFLAGSQYALAYALAVAAAGWGNSGTPELIVGECLDVVCNIGVALAINI